MIDLVILYATCASTFTLAKLSLSYAQPIFGVGIRFLVAGALFLPLTFFTRKWCSVKKGDWGLFLRVALIGIYGAYVCDLWSLQYITSSESSLLFNLSPFFSAIFSYFWFGERMNRMKWVGLLIGLSSVPLLLCLGTAGDCSTFQFSRLFPVCVALCAVTFGSYNWIVIRDLVKNRGYSPLMVNGVTMAIGGMCAVITSLFIDKSPLIFNKAYGGFLMITIINAVVCNGVFSTFYSLLLKKYTATFLSFAGCLTPIFTAILGWFFLKEPLSLTIFCAAFLVVIGLAIFYQEELRQGYISRK